MSKRGERVAPPPRSGDWTIRHTGDSVDGWEELCQQAPGPAREAYDQLERDPKNRTNPARQHQLKGGLSTREFKGRLLEQWQYEVTGAGRIWYCPDDSKHTVWLMMVSCGHPKETE